MTWILAGTVLSAINNVETPANSLTAQRSLRLFAPAARTRHTRTRHLYVGGEGGFVPGVQRF